MLANILMMVLIVNGFIYGGMATRVVPVGKSESTGCHHMSHQDHSNCTDEEQEACNPTINLKIPKIPSPAATRCWNKP
jgi:hypothetical protein